MTTAIISDIHGNAEALSAVFAEIDKRGIQRIVCLGDVVGYGPEPLRCIDMVRARCEWSLLGNHDYSILYEPTNFNGMAMESAFWTREQFESEPDESLRKERFEYLSMMPVRRLEVPPTCTVPLLAVHGSPRKPVNEYLFEEDVRNAPEKIEASFERFERIAVCGHTHYPGVFTDEMDFYKPAELGEDMTYRFSPGEKAIINVGSVGQPRDSDPRAAFIVMEQDTARFVRVAYNVEATASQIRAIPALNDYLGDRLFLGR